MSSVQTSNFRTARVVFDSWFEGRSGDREAWWLRLVAALWTESGCRILAHTGEWKGGGRINSRQRAVLSQSAQLYREKYGREPDGYGSNGGSVGALQQIPTEVSWIATKDGLDDGAPTPWAGWGTITDCMALESSIPKFLTQLRVTDDPAYKGKLTASPVVADLLRVQQPLASEVAANYGLGVLEVATAIAATFPRIEEKDWFVANNWDEAKAELDHTLDDKLRPIVDAVQKSPTVPVRRVHAYRSDDVSAPHLVANLDAGTWWWVPAGDIELVWGVQKSLFGAGAKDWIDVPYSGGKTHVDRPDVFGVQVHIYDGL